jgi:predicted  nucleic acid-binding Zn-ribbon protein
LSNDQSELQQLQEFSRRLCDDILKVTTKMDQVSNKMAQLSLSAPTAGGRDLDTLEMDISNKMRARDELSSQVTDWNEKLSSINNDVNKCTNAAAKAESNFRDVEERFRKEQEMSEKRRQLDATIMRCKDDERKVCDAFNTGKGT